MKKTAYCQPLTEVVELNIESLMQLPVSGPNTPGVGDREAEDDDDTTPVRQQHHDVLEE